MLTPPFKPLKLNGTTLYTFPSVAEDENFRNQNTDGTYQMRLSHFVLVNFPKQNLSKNILDFEDTFEQSGSSIAPAGGLGPALVESLRNYVANHETVIRNSKINSTTFYYDTFEPATTTEKIFWKWAKKLGIIDFEPADPTNDYFGADTKYNMNGPALNTNHYREYLFKERSNTVYDVTAVAAGNSGLVGLPTLPGGKIHYSITVSASTTLEPQDWIVLNIGAIDDDTSTATTSLIKVVGVTTVSTTNDKIVVEVDSDVVIGDFGTIADLELYNAYERFVQFIGEIGGVNNVQLPDKSYTEAFAYISHQHGQIPYSLWNVKADNNYKPNSSFPILPSEIQLEIQGGENPNHPILINPSLYPGDIWAHLDTTTNYTTQTGDIIRRHGNYYGNSAANNSTLNNLRYPTFDGSLIDGATLNLNIADYAKASSYIYPIESFSEFCATSFNNVAPKDFKFNAILWFYTIEDISGNSTRSATNLHSVMFLDNPANDLVYANERIPYMQKLVANGLQDGNSYTWSLDSNIAIDSDIAPPSFDPDKVYSLFGMDLFYEALRRITYFNDQITNFVNSNLNLTQKVNDLTGMVHNQQSLEAIRVKMTNLENLLNVYSTLQIGDSDTIIPRLDTSANPPLLRLDSIDKQYGYVYQYDTKDMFVEFTNVNTLTDINVAEKTVNVVNGKDFLVVVNNNDNRVPSPVYDTTKKLDNLSLVIEKDLNYKQKIDILIIPKINNDLIIPIVNPVNEPINDKKLDLYINYNDGTTTLKQLLGTFSLPVLKLNNPAPTPSASTDEFANILNDMPSYTVRYLKYSKTNTTDRIFSFFIEEDLTALPAYSRVYLNNFIVKEDPTNIASGWLDLTSQYPIETTPVFVRDRIIDVAVVDSGTGYGSSVTTNVTQTAIITTAGAPSALSVYDSNIEVTVRYTTNPSGNIISAELIHSKGLTTKTLLDGTFSGIFTINNGGTNAKIKFYIRPVTRLDVLMNINFVGNSFLANYDTLTSVSTLPQGTMIDVTSKIKIKPQITFLKGYKISIVRMSDTDIPVTLLDQRYHINIERL
jgi:hypothetical protein